MLAWSASRALLSDLEVRCGPLVVIFRWLRLSCSSCSGVLWHLLVNHIHVTKVILPWAEGFLANLASWPPLPRWCYWPYKIHRQIRQREMSRMIPAIFPQPIQTRWHKCRDGCNLPYFPVAASLIPGLSFKNYNYLIKSINSDHINYEICMILSYIYLDGLFNVNFNWNWDLNL